MSDLSHKHCGVCGQPEYACDRCPACGKCITATSHCTCPAALDALSFGLEVEDYLMLCNGADNDN